MEGVADGEGRVRVRGGRKGRSEGCIDRFKDDHALSAVHHPLGQAAPPPPAGATQFASRLETTPKFQGRVLWLEALLVCWLIRA